MFCDTYTQRQKETLAISFFGKLLRKWRFSLLRSGPAVAGQQSGAGRVCDWHCGVSVRLWPAAVNWRGSLYLTGPGPSSGTRLMVKSTLYLREASDADLEGLSPLEGLKQLIVFGEHLQAIDTYTAWLRLAPRALLMGGGGDSWNGPRGPVTIPMRTFPLSVENNENTSTIHNLPS